MDQVIRTPTQLGAALRRARRGKKLVQTDLGESTNLRQATISSLESTGSGTIDTLFAMLAALDLELVLRPRAKGGQTRLEDVF
jgi:HTH-type transcriptional regulator/antitoxin HipB